MCTAPERDFLSVLHCGFSSKSGTATEKILHFTSSLVEFWKKFSQSMPLYENAAKFFNANIIKR